jgi:hypothetical protein
MMTALLLLAAIGVSTDAPVQLQRTSKPGEKLDYSVRSYLVTETQSIGVTTFIPSTVDIAYDFTAEATGTKPDGIYDFRYKRPTMNIEEGGKKTVEKPNFDLLITLSPINEFLEVKDLTPKKPAAKPGGGLFAVAPVGVAGQQGALGGILGQFVSEIQRLALFIGSIDSAIDFQPKLDIREVSKGDSWRRTVSYSPQKLASKDGKMVMQRLDYVYTYDGIVESGGQKVHRVVATLDMKTDLLQFIRDTVDLSKMAVHFNEIGFQLKAKIDFDLDLKTGHTIKADAKSEGGFKIVVTEYPDDPYIEQKLRGHTVLKLVRKS